MTLGSLLRRAASTWSHEALVTPGFRWTFAQFDERIDDWARALLGLGVAHQEKVGILLAQDAEYFAAQLAAARIGAVAVPINARFKAREFLHVVRSSDMRVLLVDGSVRGPVNYLRVVLEAFPNLGTHRGPSLRLESAPELRHIVVFGATANEPFVSAPDFWASGDQISVGDVLKRAEAVSVRDTAIIMYTSGTTSNPKGAMLSHEALTRAAAAVGGNRQQLKPTDVVWSPLPMFHIGGTNFLLCSLTYGAKHVHVGDFSPVYAVSQLNTEGVTVALPAFDLIWMDILREPGCAPSRWNDLRMVMIAIGPPGRMMEMQKAVPQARLVSCYGATECCGFFTYGDVSDPDEIRCERTGVPLDGLELRIVDAESGQDVPAHEIGEIWYRGYTLFSGYYNDPEATSSAIDELGWFHSGDLGTVDEAGRLKFVSRLKDMMKVGGENVAAAEIEDYLQSHPDILTAQVVAAPDARYLEVPCAFVVRRVGTVVTEPDIIEFCKGKIASFKIPRYVRFVDEYPMSGTKVRKHELRQRITEELRDAGIKEAPRIHSTR
jgi:fatty-acyl-CoA synthase